MEKVCKWRDIIDEDEKEKGGRRREISSLGNGG